MQKFVDTLKRGLKKLEGQGDIDAKPRIFLTSYRGTPCPARHDKSPFELMTGRKIQSKLDLILDRSEIQENEAMASQFNRHHGAKSHSFEVNDPIYYQMHRDNVWTWQAGTVLERKGAATYIIHVNGRVIKAHTNQLKRRFTQNLPTLLIPDDDISLLYIPHNLTSPTADNNDQLGDDDPDTSFYSTGAGDDTEIPEESDTTLENDTETDTSVPQVQPQVSTRPQRYTAGILPDRFKDFVVDSITDHIAYIDGHNYF